MAHTGEKFETGIFYTRHDAEEAVHLLHALGYGVDEVAAMMVQERGIVIGVTPRDDGDRVPTEIGEVEPIPPRRVVR